MTREPGESASGAAESIDWLRRVDQVFSAALDIAETEREGWLIAACGDDEELRAEVEALLVSALESGDDLSPRASSSGEWLDRQRRRAFEPSPGQLIGGYELIERLGEGGMGTVFLAERREDGLDRKVALKVLRQAGDPRRTARFAKERRVLAGLEHPHIARLYDGGVTEDGVEYFVMEWVRGEPIDAFAERRGLDRRRRVELMVDVCRAVEAAHQKLIVHRDLKPSNIFVDGEGAVKLLDFGIATVLAGDSSAEGPGTFTSSALTLQYASPEQWRGELAAVTSDVYQIGLMLFELVAGRRPYDLEGVPPSRAGELICEVDPDPATGGDDPDLDAIVGKALRKAPGNRYASAEALRTDLERWLEGLPVRARPLGGWGRARKFIRRHRAGVLTALGGLALLLVMSGGFSWRIHRESVRAEQARQEAEATADYLEGLFEGADPNLTGGEQITVLELLVRGAEALDQELREQPRVRARLLRTHGRVLGVLGERERSLALLGQSADLWRSLPDAELELAEALRNLASQQYGGGAPVAARQNAEQALELVRAHGGSLELEAVSLTVVAETLAANGENLEAERTFLEARRLIEGHTMDSHGHDHRRQLGVIAFRLAALLSERGELESARAEAARAVELVSGVPGYRILWAHALNVEGMVLSQMADQGAALERWDQALDVFEEVHVPGHPTILGLLNNLGIAARESGQLEEARSYFERAEHGLRAADNRQMLMNVLLNLGNVDGDLGDLGGAESRYREALAVAETVIRGDHPEKAVVLFNLGEVLWKADRVREAEPHLTRSRDMFASTLGEDSPMTSYPDLLLGRIAAAGQDPGRGLVHFERAWSVRAGAVGLPAEDRREAGELYARALASAGRLEEAARVRSELAAIGG